MRVGYVNLKKFVVQIEQTQHPKRSQLTFKFYFIALYLAFIYVDVVPSNTFNNSSIGDFSNTTQTLTWTHSFIKQLRVRTSWHFDKNSFSKTYLITPVKHVRKVDEIGQSWDLVKQNNMKPKNFKYLENKLYIVCKPL